MSRMPLVWWSLALPSAAATRPSTTIGLCQCVSPIGRSATICPGRRRVDVDAAAPLDVEQAAREHGARAAVAVRPDLVQAAACELPGGGPAPRWRGTPSVPLPGRGLREEIGRPGHRDRLQLAARCGARRRRASRAGAAAACRPCRPARSSRSASSAGAVEPRSWSLAFSSSWFDGVQCFSSRFASGESTSDAVAPVRLPVEGAVAGRDEQVAGARDRRPGPSGPRSPSRSRRRSTAG